MNVSLNAKLELDLFPGNINKTSFQLEISLITNNVIKSVKGMFLAYDSVVHTEFNSFIASDDEPLGTIVVIKTRLQGVDTE